MKAISDIVVFTVPRQSRPTRKESKGIGILRVRAFAVRMAKASSKKKTPHSRGLHESASRYLGAELAANEGGESKRSASEHDEGSGLGNSACPLLDLDVVEEPVAGIVLEGEL